jgi:hypothetical protein
MSQFFQNSSSITPPPAVATQYNTQDGNAVPSANILIINAYDTTENNANGIETKGGVAGGNPPGGGAANEVDVYLTNRFRQTTTTSDDATSTVTILSGLAAGTYVLDIMVAGYATDGGPAGNGYTIVGAVRSTGAAATLIPNQQKDSFEETVGANAVLDVSLNTIIVTVTGVAAFDFDWNITGTYILVS